jgi:hypothetical protein
MTVTVQHYFQFALLRRLEEVVIALGLIGTGERESSDGFVELALFPS